MTKHNRTNEKKHYSYVRGDVKCPRFVCLKNGGIEIHTSLVKFRTVAIGKRFAQSKSVKRNSRACERRVEVESATAATLTNVELLYRNNRPKPDNAAGM